MKYNNLEEIQDEYTHFMEMAEHILKGEYQKYKQFVAEKRGEDEPLTIYSYPVFCFKIYAEACLDVYRDEQIKDLLK